jgi:RND family efflux transporter MFP subunit
VAKDAMPKPISAGFLVFLLACQGTTNAPSQSPPAVTTTTPSARTITERDEYTGRVGAVDAVELRARVSGYVESIRFRDGAMVEKGDLLLEIDPRPYRALLKAAEARLSRAKAQVETTGLLLQRAQAIRESGAVSQDTLDERLNNHLVAKAELAAARADLESARLDLTYARVRAPIRGQVGRALVDPGDLVEASGASPTLLTTIVSQDPVYFYFTINERDALHYGRLWRDELREGKRAIEARLLDETGTEHVGHIDFVDNQIDASSGTRELRAVFDNPDARLIPGMFGTIRIARGEPHEALLIPDEAIMADQAIQFVYVVGPENRVERRDVELGPKVEGLRVVRSGLSGDSQVIVKGMQRARPGAPVSPSPKSGPEAPGQEATP